LKEHLKKWVLAPDGWKLPGSKKSYDISKPDEMIGKANLKDREKYDRRFFTRNAGLKKMVLSNG